MFHSTKVRYATILYKIIQFNFWSAMFSRVSVFFFFSFIPLPYFSLCVMVEEQSWVLSAVPRQSRQDKPTLFSRTTTTTNLPHWATTNINSRDEWLVVAWGLETLSYLRIFLCLLNLERFLLMTDEVSAHLLVLFSVTSLWSSSQFLFSFFRIFYLTFLA
jgi:hypothetical protein